jgi:hypothetical protein
MASESKQTFASECIDTNIPARLDRLVWSRWHLRVVVELSKDRSDGYDPQGASKMGGQGRCCCGSTVRYYALRHRCLTGFFKFHSLTCISCGCPKSIEPCSVIPSLVSPGGMFAFLGLSGHIMKRLLQHHARPLYRRWEKVSLSEGLCPDTANPQTLHEVEDALTRLAAVNPKLRAVVEMRVFEGLTGDEIAARLACSRRSAAVYWNVAKHWLQTEWAGRLDEESKTVAAAASSVMPPPGSQHVGYPPSDRRRTQGS